MVSADTANGESDALTGDQSGDEPTEGTHG
jgi:hypothetical protein